MSWDVLLMNLPSHVTSISELGEDLRPLGSKPEVLSTLTYLLPSGDFSDTSWGIFDGDDFSIEFNIGNFNPVVTIMLHVRGSDKVIGTIQKVCEHTGWRAFDTSTGNFINFAQNPSAGLQQWRTYRDQVFAHLEAKSEEVSSDVKLKSQKARKKNWWQFWK